MRPLPALATAAQWVSRLPRDHHHALPQIGEAADAMEADDFKAVLGEQPGQCCPAPELDVPSVPECGEVLVPFPQERQHKILDVAMVGRGDHEVAAWPEDAPCVDRQQMRGEQVLHHLCGYHGIERGFMRQELRRVVLHPEVVEGDFRMGAARDLHTLPVVFHPDDAIAEGRQPQTQRAISRPEVQHPADAQSLQDLDDFRRDVIVGFRALGGGPPVVCHDIFRHLSVPK